ncbi:hypothetical protein K438DRAFT_1981372 [Mycena galopus ATCC 62051]|nr:hypothetical protein K438DRAFT_1981372 [Mycena galopus ATCC 62051]
MFLQQFQLRPSSIPMFRHMSHARFPHFGGLIKRIRKKDNQLQAMRLTKLNDTRMLAGKIAELDFHKQFMIAIATSDERRISKLIRTRLNNGESIGVMLERFYRACVDVHHEGLKYNPKGFTQDDYMVGLCVLRLGGARLADILHRALGLPGLTTLRKHSVIKPLCASPAMPIIAEIEANIDAYTAGEETPSGPPEIVHRVMMLDELAVEQRARHDDKTNKILSACREHGAIEGVELCHLDDAITFFECGNNNEVHSASEATVAALGSLGRKPQIYNPRPVCISVTCKTEKGPQRATFLRNLLDATNSRKVHGISVTSDGEAKRGLALALENFSVGPDDITADKDYHHVIKVLPSLLMRQMGVNLLGFVKIWESSRTRDQDNSTRSYVTIVPNIPAKIVSLTGFDIVPAVVTQHLRDAELSEEHIRSLLNPNINDRQDVDLTYGLLKEIWCLPLEIVPTASPTYIRAHRALYIFGRLTYHLSNNDFSGSGTR